MRDDETEKAAQARVGTVINGKWTVERLIGVGGMASVYAAIHRNSKRAALKIMHPELSAQAGIRERFLREGYLSNMVDHPGVVTVDDDDVTEDGCAYLVMELVEGETLEARLRRKGPLPIDEVLIFMDQVLHALATAHTRGVVHRDLKPENMLLSRNGEVKLLDFGIARARALSTDPTKTLTEGLMGTPAFMPPEQARGRWAEVDAQSDVWALGATMFTLLTGRNVHQAATTNEALAVAMMRQAPRLEEFRPDLPASVLDLVNRALAFEKKDRWPNATVMLLAVRRASARLDEEQLEADALAAARHVRSHADSQPELFFSETDGGEELAGVFDDPDSEPAAASPAVGSSTSLRDYHAESAPEPSRSSAPAPEASSSPSDEPPTNPVSSEAPFVLHAEAPPAGAFGGTEPPVGPGPGTAPAASAPGQQPESPSSHSSSSEAEPGPRSPTEASRTPDIGPADQEAPRVPSAPESSLPHAASVPGSAEVSERYLASNGSDRATADLPARRVVPFSDVPAAGPESARPTETTTARSALTTDERAPLRSTRWSLIGGAVAALILLIVLLSMLSGGGGDSTPEAERGTAGPARVVAAPAPAQGQTVLDEEPDHAERGATDEGANSKRPDSAASESVDLETLPVLSAEPSQAPAPMGQWRAKPQPKEPSNIFNKARNLAVERASKRSGDVKSGKPQ